MLTPNLHGAIGGIVANPGVLLALGAALTLIWLGAALLSALRRRSSRVTPRTLIHRVRDDSEGERIRSHLLACPRD